MTRKRMLIIQHASEELGFRTLREAVLSLRPGDKIMVLAIIQQASSTTVQSGKLQDNEKMKDIKEAIKQKQDEYSNSAEIEGIRILAGVQQVEFEIAVEAGFLNEVAAKYVKKIEATRVVLPREEELRFIKLNRHFPILATPGAEVHTSSRNCDTVHKLFDKMSDSNHPSMCFLEDPIKNISSTCFDGNSMWVKECGFDATI